MSASSSSWGLGRAAVYDCGTPWTFLLPFFLNKSTDCTVAPLSRSVGRENGPERGRKTLERSVDELLGEEGDGG